MTSKSRKGILPFMLSLGRLWVEPLSDSCFAALWKAAHPPAPFTGLPSKITQLMTCVEDTSER